MGRQKGGETIAVAVGFAADRSGVGVAYAAFQREGRERLLRIPFRLKRSAALQDREVGYAALRAIADAVRSHEADAVRFVTGDESLVADLDERRPLPAALIMPYVALRCALNRFQHVSVVAGHDSPIDDLSARANAEASLHIAA